MVLWAHRTVTLVLVLTHCENICLLNYANVAKVVITFLLTMGATLRLAPHYQRDKVFKAFISKCLKCVPVVAPK